MTDWQNTNLGPLIAMIMNMNPPSNRLHMRTELNDIKILLFKVYFHHSWLTPVSWEIIFMESLPFLCPEIHFSWTWFYLDFQAQGSLMDAQFMGVISDVVLHQLAEELLSCLQCSWLRFSSSYSSCYCWYRWESSKLLSSPSIRGEIRTIPEWQEAL